MEQLVNVITVIGVVFLFITFIVNKRISELVSKSEITVGKKKIKIGTLCLKGFLIMCYISVIIVCIVNIITRLVYYFELEELDFEETISKNKEEIQIETDYYNEIINNPNIQITSILAGTREWIRITGIAYPEERIEKKELIFNENKVLYNIYNDFSIVIY